MIYQAVEFLQRASLNVCAIVGGMVAGFTITGTSPTFESLIGTSITAAAMVAFCGIVKRALQP